MTAYFGGVRWNDKKVYIKALADGQLPSSVAALYTCPANTEVMVLGIVLVNTGSSPLTANLYANTSGTRRRICPKNLQLVAGAQYELDQPVALEAGDSIDGDASSATTVDYTISGEAVY